MKVQHGKGKVKLLCIISSLGQVQFFLDKYIKAIYLFLQKYQYCYFHTPDQTEKAYP